MLEGDKSALKSFGDGNCPYTSSYRPELDVINEIYSDLTNRLQKKMGVLRWSIELGRTDIMTEVGFLSQHLSSPCEVHNNAIYKIFRYLHRNL